jgi:hypothetical protein
VTSPQFITLPDGRRFPAYEGEALSWDFGIYLTAKEEHIGLARARAVLAALAAERSDQLQREYQEALKGCIGTRPQSFSGGQTANTSTEGEASTAGAGSRSGWCASACARSSRPSSRSCE